MITGRFRWGLAAALFGVVALIGYWWVRMTIESVQAQSRCYTIQEVSSGCGDSSQCLYIYEDEVYERGTCSNSHQGHPCGSDITDIFPDWHPIGGGFAGSQIGVVCAGPVPTPPVGSSDLNNNGEVDIYDLNMLFRYYGNTGGAGGIPGDIVQDGYVDMMDLLVLLSNL